jgi:hypothetical protein
MNARISLIGVLTAVTLLLAPAAANAQRIIGSNETAQSLEVRNVAVNNNVITGEVVNKTPHLMRDVELLIKYHWRWKNEMKPGADSSGRSVFIKLDRDLRPGEPFSFTYKPDPPLPSRPEGYYVAEVSPAGFAVVTPP